MGTDLHHLTLGKVDFVRATAVSLPIRSETFDMVVCASLIEHVPSPENLLLEIYRVLRKRGWLYLSFPPFYTPIGGHQFSPFHLLGERTALRIVRFRGLCRGKPWLQKSYPTTPDSFAHAYGDWGLYPLTIGRVEGMLRKLPWERLERSTRWLPIDFSSIPLLREVVTWHVQFVLRKSGNL